MNFNFNVQRELPGAMVLQLGYVGSLGRHLELSYEGNPITPAGAATCLADPICVANRSSLQIYLPSSTEYVPGDILQSVGVQSTVGVSSYSSLQASLNKRFNHGLSFLASYTWSHAIDDTSGFEDSVTGAAALIRTISLPTKAIRRTTPGSVSWSATITRFRMLAGSGITPSPEDCSTVGTSRELLRCRLDFRSIRLTLISRRSIAAACKSMVAGTLRT
jgi:hypothetical protein